MGSLAMGNGRHRTRPRLRAWNAFTCWLLHVPGLRRLADGQVCELRFAAARSGRPVALPVMYAQHGDTLVVLVGGPRSKRWWRNFTQPHAVQVWLRGTARSGTGHVVGPDSRDRDEAARIYMTKFPDIPVQNDPMVVIALDRAV